MLLLLPSISPATSDILRPSALLARRFRQRWGARHLPARRLYQAQLLHALHHALGQVLPEVRRTQKHALPLRRHDGRLARLLLHLPPLLCILRLLQWCKACR